MCNHHRAALLALLAAACSAIPDDTAGAAGGTGTASIVEVVELPADVAGVEVSGIVLGVHACQAPLATSWCEPVMFFLDGDTLYTPAASPMVLRVVVAR